MIIIIIFFYCNRFANWNSFQDNNGWPWQLLSVACLSLAAKMEETAVPSLLDLQVLSLAIVKSKNSTTYLLLIIIMNTFLIIIGWRCKIYFWNKNNPSHGASRAECLGLEAEIGNTIQLHWFFRMQARSNRNFYGVSDFKGHKNHFIQYPR